ncbi:MAG: lysophospholipase [Ruminococcus sp.]|nr:lysophospholipase [Ruminococcus sp.]
MLNASIKETTFESEFDTLDISVLTAVPTGEINGVVQIVHGMNEYKERYLDFMEYLTEQGFIAAIHDNRGHGKSICTDDDLGFMFRNGGEGFVSDIAQFNRILHETYPDVPLFMIGHSMGSLGVRCFLKNHDSNINGLIISGSPSYSSFSGVFRTMGNAVSRHHKSRYRNPKIGEAMEKVFNKNFGDVPHSWLSSRKEIVEEFNSNPKSSFVYTINGYQGLLYLLRETYSKKNWNVTNPHLPIRFISGKDDPVMLSEKKFFEAIHMLESVGYESISHRLFENMRHEVLNEKNNIAVYRDIAKTLFSWIDRLSR